MSKQKEQKESKAQQNPVIHKNPPKRQGIRPFQIVGIGASAGGLVALELFLANVPLDTGMAFVIVQHLDPTHKGFMTELLQRVTVMQVQQVVNQTNVQPNCVYVIPPNKEMSILHGVLYLFESSVPRGLSLPIDFFLCSLAEDCQERSIGVILSGMGSDGTIGLRAIKEKGGLTLVQDPVSARFDRMPLSAIDNGVAELIAPVEELPGAIINYLSNAHDIAKSKLPVELNDKSSFEEVLIMLRAKTGQDFTLYKKNTIYRRVERRMNIHQIDKIAAYVRFLQENSQEIDLLFKELLIGVTSFFRDPDEWALLKNDVIPALLKSYQDGGTIRIWSVGCSSGEEAYSLAIIFMEALEHAGLLEKVSVQIFATDLDSDAIDRGRQGEYTAHIAADVSDERLQSFFVKDERGYRVGKNIRESVTFAVQNVIMDPPFIKLDMLVCRNLLIYLTQSLQKKLLPLFHYSLKPGGVLFLGGSETTSFSTDLFTQLNIKSRLFYRRESVAPAGPVMFPISYIPSGHGVAKEAVMIKSATSLQVLADQLLLQHFSPPAVLTNDMGDILYISGRTGSYLEPAAGKANWNIFAMAREGIRFDLYTAFQKAVRLKEMVTVKNLKTGDGISLQTVEITVKAVQEPDALKGMVMIVFNDVTSHIPRKVHRRSKSELPDSKRIIELEQELHQFSATLQTAREDMQSSQEELKSTNEELQSTNEELQSTNEELTTSREEMQSLNEELQTVNAEQQSKMEELARVNNDMRNLLNSTGIVTVFLDNELRVRRFTSGADKIFKLIPADVGRPLSDVASELHYPEMSEVAHEVLRSQVCSEKQVSTDNGRWFSVRIMPYRTTDDVIGGVVITFADITVFKTLEVKLYKENARLMEMLG